MKLKYKSVIKSVRHNALGAFSNRDDSIYKTVDMKIPPDVKAPVTINIVHDQSEASEIRRFMKGAINYNNGWLLEHPE